jgi:hypothetical protein
MQPTGENVLQLLHTVAVQSINNQAGSRLAFLQPSILPHLLAPPPTQLHPPCQVTREYAVNAMMKLAARDSSQSNAVREKVEHTSTVGGPLSAPSPP